MNNLAKSTIEVYMLSLIGSFIANALVIYAYIWAVGGIWSYETILIISIMYASFTTIVHIVKYYERNKRLERLYKVWGAVE